MAAPFWIRPARPAARTQHSQLSSQIAGAMALRSGWSLVNRAINEAHALPDEVFVRKGYLLIPA